VQGRHPLQTSDALRTAGVQIGPEAIATAAVLNKQLGLSFGQSATFFAERWECPSRRARALRQDHPRANADRLSCTGRSTLTR
jgi:transposase